jgi:glycerol-3-phosphate dehydrogenase
VRESALERVYFQRLAPHLTHYVPFLVPTYSNWRKGKAIMIAGMTAYQTLCVGQNKLIKDQQKKVPGWEILNREEVLKRIPGIHDKDLTGGVLFYESHMHNSERMVLAFLEHAYRLGAVMANYVEATGFIREDNRICGVMCNDLETDAKFEIRAKVVVNASGPWIPGLNTSLDTSPDKSPLTSIVTGYSKGAHIVTESVTKNCAIALPTNKQSEAVVSRGGRHVFIIPWRGYSLIGTTYTSYQGDLENVAATEADIEELIEDINQAFNKVKVRREQVKYAYAGIYPLVTDSINPELYQGTGDYRIVNHENEDGLAGLISAFGAKYTTARLLAEKTLNEIKKSSLKMKPGLPLREIALVSGDIDSIESFSSSKKAQYSDVFSQQVIENLVTNFGTDIDDVIKLARDKPELQKSVSDGRDTIRAQIIYAVKNEMALHLDDVIFRRTGLGTLGQPDKESLRLCAELMAKELDWDETRVNAEIATVEKRFNYV